MLSLRVPLSISFCMLLLGCSSRVTFYAEGESPPGAGFEPSDAEGADEAGAAPALELTTSTAAVPSAAASAPVTPTESEPSAEAPGSPALSPAAPPSPSPEPNTSEEPVTSVGPEPDPASLARCTGSDPISCHFAGPPGNYFVTVLLGGDVAAHTEVLAETRRTMLAAVATAAGESRRFTFGVNVRQPEGEPLQDVPAGTPGLDLYFRGSAGVAPALSGIGYAPAMGSVMIYVAGDSTVADQTSADYGGWAQQLPQHFDYPVVIANYADSGESSGSFLNARPLFGAIEANLAANDYVLLQFGHNDKAVSAAQFHDNMSALVRRVKAKGAVPVLLSPVARAQFDGSAVAVQHVNGTGANLPAIVEQVASEQQVTFLDLTASTSEWLASLGPRGWQPFHALGSDVTHTNDAGAAVEAELVRSLLLDAQLLDTPLLNTQLSELTQHLR